ncbi:MAG: glycosyltransferase family 9 protein [Planctomycetaceae bacterium]|nr:glycosyltransferase family 9 protein [Planctomycetaceae bacterium]
MANVYHNILVIKPSSLGDIVHALPAVAGLRKQLPNARITWLVRRQFAPLLKNIGFIDELLLFERDKMAAWFYSPAALRCLLNFREQLKNGRFDLVLDLQGLLRSGLFAWMTGSTARVGLAEAREGARFFYTKRVDAPSDSPHILDYYYKLLNEIGIRAVPAEFRLAPPDEAAKSIEAKMSRFGLSPKRFVVLVPSSAHAAKCWPAQRFAAIAEQLRNRFQWDLAAVGTAADKEIIARIQRHCADPIIDLSGQTSLPELAALFERSAAVISNDTGPGYIAAACGVPTVIVFGRTNPLRLGPYKRPDCIAAVHLGQRGWEIESSNPAFSIEHVPVEMVFEKILSQLNRKTA